MSRSISNSSRAVIVALSFILSSCGSPENPPDIQRIVLVTIDTLRTDHLSLYGYPRETSPFIDSLGKSGVVFDRAYTSMPTTVPSHASLFTSLYPLQHGIRNNFHKLNSDQRTLAEVMRDNGFVTAAFPSVWFLTGRGGGLERGFDVVGTPPRPKQGQEKYRGAQETVSTVIEWLNEKSASDKLFIWVHLFDPHQPLRPPNEQLNEILSLKDEQKMVPFLTKVQKIELDVHGEKNEMLSYVNKYDAEVRYADTQLRRLYDAMLRYDGETLWIITADHGQGLGTHHYKHHSSRLYNEQLQVPLIFHSTTGRFPPARIDALAENIDVFPTLVDLLNLKVEVIPDSVGCSLYPYLVECGEKYCEKSFAFSEQRVFSNRRDDHEKRPEFAVQSSNLKIIKTITGQEQVFDMTSGPYEQKKLAKPAWPEATSALRQEMGQRLEFLLQNAAQEGELVDEEVMNNLRSLGYIQ